MHGINRYTGKTLSGEGHLRQSIIDILTTPIGTRVMRRDYGSRLFEFIDAPINRGTLIEIYAATAEALRRWEPRLAVSRVQVTAVTPGKVELTLEGIYLPDGRPVVLEGLVV